MAVIVSVTFPWPVPRSRENDVPDGAVLPGLDQVIPRDSVDHGAVRIRQDLTGELRGRSRVSPGSSTDGCVDQLKSPVLGGARAFQGDRCQLGQLLRPVYPGPESQRRPPSSVDVVRADRPRCRRPLRPDRWSGRRGNHRRVCPGRLDGRLLDVWRGGPVAHLPQLRSAAALGLDRVGFSVSRRGTTSRFRTASKPNLGSWAARLSARPALPKVQATHLTAPSSTGAGTAQKTAAPATRGRNRTPRDRMRS